MTEKAQVGDLIRFTGDSDYFVRGEIYEVIDGNCDAVMVENPGGPVFIWSGDYVIHRKAGEEDAPCDDFIVEGCLFQTQDGKVRKAKRVTDDWVYGDDGERYKRMFVERITDVSVYKGYEIKEGVELAERKHKVLSEGDTQADRIKRAGTELTDLLVRKNHDYGDSFAKQYEKYGLMSALIRMDDKMRRLETLLDGTDAQVDESIKDTLLDLAGYALLASIEAGKR